MERMTPKKAASFFRQHITFSFDVERFMEEATNEAYGLLFEHSNGDFEGYAKVEARNEREKQEKQKSAERKQAEESERKASNQKRTDHKRSGNGTLLAGTDCRLAFCTSPDKTDTEIWLTNAVCYRSECCTAFKVASRHKRQLPTGYPPFIPFALLNYVTHSEKG